MQLYGAGLLGNLAGHSASAAVVAGVRGAARELVRMLRDCGAEPHSEYTLPLLGGWRTGGSQCRAQAQSVGRGCSCASCA